VGIQTHSRVERLVEGHVDAFAIFFEPTGMKESFSTPPPDLTKRVRTFERLFNVLGAPPGERSPVSVNMD
jgi:hypothetical protein